MTDTTLSKKMRALDGEGAIGVAQLYLVRMLQRTLPVGFIAPCLLAFPFRGAYVPAVSRAYLSRKLTRPLPTKDGGTLRTVLDARAYMLRLSKDRERSARCQRAAQLLLAKSDVGAISRQLELALLYDGELDVRAMA